jgi:hypothetical protein
MMMVARENSKRAKEIARDGQCFESKSRVDFSLYCSLVS